MNMHSLCIDPGAKRILTDSGTPANPAHRAVRGAPARLHLNLDRRLPETSSKSGEEDYGTELTLGENAELYVDEFVYEPDGSEGLLLLRVVRGTFLFVGGKVEEMANSRVRIETHRGKKVTLNAGQGTMVYDNQAPIPAYPWSKGKTGRAVATISFDDYTARGHV